VNNNDKIRQRGYAARRILEDAEVMEAFGEIEADLLTKWAATNPDRSDDREAIYRQVKALDLFQQQLEAWRNNLLHLEASLAQSKRDQTGLGAEA